MKNNIDKLLFMIFVSIWLSINIWAKTTTITTQSCEVPYQSENDLKESLDFEIGSYVQEDEDFRTYSWKRFGFVKEYWDDGFGYKDQTNIQLPLARTYNAMYLMKAVQDDWYYWATGQINGLHFMCHDDWYIGTATKQIVAKSYSDYHVVLYLAFTHWIRNAIDRSLILVQIAKRMHTSFDGGNDCPAGENCDSSWNDNGVNATSVLYLRDLACTQNDLITPTMRYYAADEGNAILDNNFVNQPGFMFTDLVANMCGDNDSDGVSDQGDNCPNTSNINQKDSDKDGVGDACDVCPNTKDTQTDSDQDGDGNACDNCPMDFNPSQMDLDQDTWGDACDNCPSAFNFEQWDTDSDGAGDICDPDLDGDGIDNCMYI